MKNPYWDAPEWLHTEAGELFHSLIRDGKGLGALRSAVQAGFAVNKRLVSDALDATSMSLAFARQRADEEKIRELEDELQQITEEFGDPHR